MFEEILFGGPEEEEEEAGTGREIESMYNEPSMGGPI